MKKGLILGIGLLWLGGTLFAKPCYLIVEKSGNFDSSIVQSMSESIISQYIEPISPIPKSGFSDKDCHYRVTITESQGGFTAAVSGRISAFGQSQKAGMDGLTQAFFASDL